ncbi:MAG: hypothetical protein SFY96_11175 [Planctomycetota bacterium]|nr:hypothetical protein [Planctomycetota bacterium]
MRNVNVTGAPSPRLLRACALFGLRPMRTARAAASRETRLAAAQVLSTLAPGQIALLSGPSGGGKTTLLRACRAELVSRHEAVAFFSRPPLGTRRTLIDSTPGAMRDALRDLARAGLADATLLARCTRELSEGQRWRWALARMLRTRPRWLLIDEFVSTLDRPAARGVCRALRRHARDVNCRVIVATAHDDVATWLEPDMRVRVELQMPPRVEVRDGL